MMKKFASLFLLVCIVTICIVAVSASPNVSNDSDIHLFYEYIQRVNEIVESPEWMYMSREERLVTTKLTAEEIVAMSTETLLRASLASPFAGNVFFFNSARDGFEVTFSQNPGLQELSTRSDFIDAFITVYAIVESSLSNEFSRVNTLSEPDCVLLLPLMELIVAQPEMQQHMSVNQAIDLVELFVERRTDGFYGNQLSDIFFDFIDQSENISLFDAAIFHRWQSC